MSRLASRPSFAILVLAAFLGAVIIAVGPAAAVNPSAADITNARDRAVDDTEEASTGASITTTTVNVMAAVADSDFNEMTMQSFRIVNTHTSQHLCLKTVDRAPSISTRTERLRHLASATFPAISPSTARR